VYPIFLQSFAVSQLWLSFWILENFSLTHSPFTKSSSEAQILGVFIQGSLKK